MSFHSSKFLFEGFHTKQTSPTNLAPSIHMDETSASPFIRNLSELFRINEATHLESLSNPTMTHANPRIEGDVAVRLYQSVRRTTVHRGGNVINSSQTNSEANMNSPTCRICRYVSESQQLIPSPCKCTGTMGFVHSKCLNRWIRVRRTKLCEICKAEYNTPTLKRNYYTFLLALFRPKYLGVVLKDIFNIMSVTPLVYFTVNQLVETMEASSEKPTLKLLVFGPALLLATSVYFFLYFDWALSCLFRIKNVLNHWWSFGDQDDDEIDDFIPDFDFQNDFFEIEF